MLPNDKIAIQLLNQFLKLNTARYLGFQNAGKQTDVEVLQVLFERLMGTSAQCSEELCKEIFKIGGQPMQEKYRAQFDLVWKEIQQALVDNNHPAILDACFNEEQMAYKVYEYALRYFADSLSTQQKNLCQIHLDRLRSDHYKVQNLRNVLLNAA